MMVDKMDFAGRRTCPISIRDFKRNYVRKMDASAHKLKEEKFSSVKEAQLVLCQMIRSFVPYLAAHVDRNRLKESRRVTFCCSTLNHMEKKVEGSW